MRTAWLDDQIRAFESLNGRTVREWWGIEMAFRDEPGGAWQFSDPLVPCLQLLALEALLDGDEAVQVLTSQNDSQFGLSLRHSDVWREPWRGSDGYRGRSLDELPVGAISAARVLVDFGDLAEVRLLVDGRDLLLMAGEVDDQLHGGLHFARMDESVLVFTVPSDADSIEWTPPRQSGAQLPKTGMPLIGHSVRVSDLRAIAAKKRRRYVLSAAIGIPMAVVGVIFTTLGKGEGPREVWFSTANWADWLGGSLIAVGALLVAIGWLGRRNG